jgi:hypothetical protein
MYVLDSCVIRGCDVQHSPLLHFYAELVGEVGMNVRLDAERLQIERTEFAWDKVAPLVTACAMCGVSFYIDADGFIVLGTRSISDYHYEIGNL